MVAPSWIRAALEFRVSIASLRSPDKRNLSSPRIGLCLQVQGGACDAAEEATWRSLVERFGALQRCEMLGTAPYLFHDVGVRSYVELEFERIAMTSLAGTATASSSS